MPNKLSENKNIVFVLKPADNQGGLAGDSINMGKVRRVAFILQFGAITNDAVLTLKSGATAGTETTAETFHYRLADGDHAAANADTYGDWTDSSSLTLTAVTYDNRTLIVEIDSDELTADQPWLTLALSSAASTLFSSVVAVCDPKIEAHDIPTVIA